MDSKLGSSCFTEFVRPMNVFGCSAEYRLNRYDCEQSIKVAVCIITASLIHTLGKVLNIINDDGAAQSAMRN